MTGLRARLPRGALAAAARRARWRLGDRLPGLLGPDWRAAQAAMPARVAAIRARPGPVRVAFVVASPAKWNAQSLFDALAADPGFAPVFHPAPSDVDLRLDPGRRRAAMERLRAFFAARGPVAAPPRDPIAPVDPRMVEAELAFVQQPWGMRDLPRRLTGRALTAYIHYGYPVIRNPAMQFGLPDFHPFLWRHVVPTAQHADEIRAAGPARAAGLLVAGHPRLDAYCAPPPPRAGAAPWPHAAEAGRRRVLLALHHALEPGSLRLATLDWSAPAMLDLARAHPQVDFVLRPHPNLGAVMARLGRGRAHAALLAAWRALPNAALDEAGGPYLGTFRTSDALITDCGAFLAEYLPTGRPLIRLTRPGSAPLNAAGAALAEGIYAAGDAGALGALFARVVIAGDDPLAAARARAAAALMPEGASAAARIRDHLTRALRP